MVQIDFILLYEYQGLILSHFPPTPCSSVYSLGLLLRPDKQGFFCLWQLLPEDCFECDLTVNEEVGAKEGESDERKYRPTSRVHHSDAVGHLLLTKCKNAHVPVGHNNTVYNDQSVISHHITLLHMVLLSSSKHEWEKVLPD